MFVLCSAGVYSWRLPNPLPAPPPLPPPSPADLLNNRPLGQRALVISAGVIANIIFAFAVLFAQVRGRMGYQLAALSIASTGQLAWQRVQHNH